MKKTISHFLLILTLGLLLAGCGKTDGSGKAGKGAVNEAGESEIGVHHKVYHFRLEGLTKEGKDQWYLEGKFAKVVGSDVIIRDIKGEGSKGDIEAVLIADGGVYNKETGVTELKGNVLIATSDNGRISMDYARWDTSKEEITTDSDVKIEHSGITLDGTGAIVKPNQEWAELTKNIKAIDSTKRIITCEGPLQVNYKKRVAIFNNNVVIVDPEGKICAEKLIAYFNPDTREIERLEWIGDVKAVY